MKKLIILALIGGAVAATPAVAEPTGIHGNDWRELVCKISPRRCR